MENLNRKPELFSHYFYGLSCKVSHENQSIECYIQRISFWFWQTSSRIFLHTATAAVMMWVFRFWEKWGCRIAPEKSNGVSKPIWV